MLKIIFILLSRTLELILTCLFVTIIIIKNLIDIKINNLTKDDLEKIKCNLSSQEKVIEWVKIFP